MKNFIVVFSPNGIDKFLCAKIQGENLIDAAIIFERENNGSTIIQLTLIS